MALAGVALASCVNDVADVAQNEQKKALIGFQSPVIYQNATSRYVAGEIDGTTYPTDENFMVAARTTADPADNWDAGTNYWGEDADDFLKVSYVGTPGGWKTAEDYYWPTYELSFVAYSPAELVGTNLTSVEYTNAGWNFKGFVVPDDQDEKIDLLYSDLITGKKGNTTIADDLGGYYGVPVVFKHALSSIHFKVVKAATVDAEVKLGTITISGVKNKGNFKVNSNGPAWEAATDAKATAYEPYKVAGGGLVFTDAQAAVGTDDENSLLLMPQGLGDVTMVVTYYVNGVQKTTSPISLNNLKENNEAPAITAWAPGTRYTYILNYSALAEDLIYFAPSVTDWTDVSLTINLD